MLRPRSASEAYPNGNVSGSEGNRHLALNRFPLPRMSIRFPSRKCPGSITGPTVRRSWDPAYCLTGEKQVSLPIGLTVGTMSILPVLVFLAESCVVTLSTVRTIFITRGMKELAALLGFFEISIWLFAIAQVMQHLSSLDCYLAFAGGFSLGNFLGVLIERKLALGIVSLQVATRKDGGPLMDALRSADYAVTAFDAVGSTSSVRVMITAVRRKELPAVVSIIKRYDPEAFYCAHDLQLTPQRPSYADRGRAHALVRDFIRHAYRLVSSRATNEPVGSFHAIPQIESPERAVASA